MRHKYLSYTMALILQAIENGYRYGFEVMQITGLASGTIYPALRRLEDATLSSRREKWKKRKKQILLLSALFFFLSARTQRSPRLCCEVSFHN